MLELRACYFQVDQLCLGRFQLRFRLRDIRVGSHAGIEALHKRGKLPSFVELPDDCELVIPGAAETVGNRPARVTRTTSRAYRNCASAASTFWFEMLTCSSRAFN